VTEDIFTTIQKERNAAERRAFEAGTKLALLVGRYGKDGSVPVAEVHEVMRFLIPGSTPDQS
jgi:hypothetical protein